MLSDETHSTPFKERRIKRKKTQFLTISENSMIKGCLYLLTCLKACFKNNPYYLHFKNEKSKVRVLGKSLVDLSLNKLQCETTWSPSEG